SGRARGTSRTGRRGGRRVAQNGPLAWGLPRQTSDASRARRQGGAGTRRTGLEEGPGTGSRRDVALELIETQGGAVGFRCLGIPPGYAEDSAEVHVGISLRVQGIRP